MKQEFLTSVLNQNKFVNLPYQLILFDFDGTLCNTEGVDISAIQKTYRILNHTPPTLDEIRAALGKGFIIEGIFQSLSPNASSHLIQQLLLTYRATYRAEAGAAELFHDAAFVLKQLKEAGIINVVVSNKAISTLETAILAMQIDPYFERIVGVREDGICKPDPMLYQHYIAPHFSMIEPHKILMVGDTSTDLRFAKAIHVQSAWASYGLGDAKSCIALKPAHTLEKITDLLDIVLYPGLR